MQIITHFHQNGRGNLEGNHVSLLREWSNTEYNILFTQPYCLYGGISNFQYISSGSLTVIVHNKLLNKQLCTLLCIVSHCRKPSTEPTNSSPRPLEWLQGACSMNVGSCLTYVCKAKPSQLYAMMRQTVSFSISCVSYIPISLGFRILQLNHVL